MSKFPDFGAYCTVYRARDQRQGNLDLPNTPGICVDLGIHQKTLGFMVTDTTLTKLVVTRQHLRLSLSPLLSKKLKVHDNDDLLFVRRNNKHPTAVHPFGYTFER